MPRVTHVNKSQKVIPQSVCGIDGGIPKGSAYYWWKFRRGGKHYSLTPPKRSQLTRSSFFATIYNLEDGDIQECEHNTEAIESMIENVKDALEELRDESQGNLENLPQQLQENHMLNERIENLESTIQELDGIDVPGEDAADEEFDTAIEQVSNALGNLS